MAANQIGIERAVRHEHLHSDLRAHFADEGLICVRFASAQVMVHMSGDDRDTDIDQGEEQGGGVRTA